MQTFTRGFILTLIGFALGSLPFSLWLGRRFLRTDIRAVGDHNPGATNVLRAGGRWSAAAALLLDIAKGFLPVALAYRVLGLPTRWLVACALAPVLGHAFSPLLGGRGGKAVAVTGGIWMGLTLWEGPTIGGLTLLALSKTIRADGWAVLPAVATMLLYLLTTPRTWNAWWPRPTTSVIAATGLGNLTILAWKHRADFRNGPSRAAEKGNR
jgi:glycerol-3-phosphate acyltransferase PlsY